eukprot:CAMPEP_0177214436 /NCGR_PEP_ID=MMETSP0367-20130122/33691_1 /TAXON_ID=447022 ORGANISM="Scrippsiella hangoei-like, Strain SHHI-4" /NCGR_SAMPLE_ID=MMETSP0367 /ASSEMBLY_ACC=CAM_ASM_000362 /LENGTH=49 /DNA_ID= /DNA_START= /DNA_END= /DNA_ORIENTATION=
MVCIDQTSDRKTTSYMRGTEPLLGAARRSTGFVRLPPSACDSVAEGGRE